MKIQPMWTIPHEEGLKIHVLLGDFWFLAIVAKDENESYYLESHNETPLADFLKCKWSDFDGWRNLSVTNNTPEIIKNQLKQQHSGVSG